MKTESLPFVLERIQRCQFCGREMPARSLGYQENPFCRVCLNERQLLAADGPERPIWRAVGDYVERVTTVPRKHC